MTCGQPPVVAPGPTAGNAFGPLTKVSVEPTPGEAPVSIVGAHVDVPSARATTAWVHRGSRSGRTSPAVGARQEATVAAGVDDVAGRLEVDPPPVEVGPARAGVVPRASSRQRRCCATLPRGSSCRRNSRWSPRSGSDCSGTMHVGHPVQRERVDVRPVRAVIPAPEQSAALGRDDDLFRRGRVESDRDRSTPKLRRYGRLELRNERGRRRRLATELVVAASANDRPAAASSKTNRDQPNLRANMTSSYCRLPQEPAPTKRPTPAPKTCQ